MGDSATEAGAQALVKESIALLSVPESDLVAQVFGELFRRHPEVEPLFAAHSKVNRHQMLREILEMVAADWDQSPWLQTHLMELGRRHEGYEVDREMYGWFEECLMRTLAKIAGDAWKPEYDRAWRQALQRLVRSMTD